MGFTKEQLVAHLKDLEIDFAQYEHPVVLTVEAQAKYVGDKGGALSKNLFLKDKKSRFYIVSALVDTKVDLKILSQRLGLGKGGIRMAPEDALGDILQVPLGCVTPFALINEMARHVSLLLDRGFKSQKCCFFHPLSNDVSISLTSHDLDKFLKSIGREPLYVDLEDNPPVGKDQPPDLAALVPSGSTIVPELSQTPASSEVPIADPVSADQKPSFVKDSKPKKAAVSKASRKEESSDNPTQPSPLLDAGQFVQQFLNKISALSLSEVTEDTIKQNGGNLGSVVADSIRKHLGSDLNSLAMTFKNTSYTQGFHAGVHCHQR